MITLDTLSPLLDQLSFTQSSQKHSKTIGDATFTADRKKGEISYPEAQGLIIDERQTCYLTCDKNCVVLECVHHLLERSYKPANIELELNEALNIPLARLAEQQHIAAASARKHAILERHL